MTRDQFLSYFFVALFVLVFFQVLMIFSSFFQAIFWACVLVFAFYPFYQKILSWCKGSQTLAALLCTLILFLACVPMILGIVLNVVKETLDLYQVILNNLNEDGGARFIEKLRQIRLVREIEIHLGQLEGFKRNLQTWMLNMALHIGEWTAKQSGVIAKDIIIIIANFFLTFFLLFFFFRDGEKIYEFIYKITPLEKKNKEHVFLKINETFSAVIRGQLLTSGAQALTAGIVFWLLGVKLPIFLAGATFITSMIPVVGASCVWAPVMLYLFATGHTTKALILLFAGIFGISLVDNILKPAIIGEKTKLPYFLLFLAILGGVKVYGVVGAFLAPMILSVFFALIQIYREKYL